MQWLEVQVSLLKQESRVGRGPPYTDIPPPRLLREVYPERNAMEPKGSQ